jgi:dihydrolipoamide dehydrogenase
MARFDLVILGAGPGGVAAAIRGAQLGASVAVIEPDKCGGFCLNQACIPTKFLATAAERLVQSRAAPEYGFKKLKHPPELDPAALWAQKGQLTEYFAQGTQGLLSGRGIKLFARPGRLVGPGRVAAGDESLEAGAIIVACGSEWAPPDIPGSNLKGVINSSQFLDQDELPKRSLLMGGGPWQLELALLLTAADASATVVEKNRNILPGWDSDLSRRLRSIINREPLTILNQSEVTAFKKGSGDIRVVVTVRGQEQILTVDRVIYFQRRPALEKLGLEKVGLSDLSVDEHQATQAEGIYAVGDITADCLWSHFSAAQGVAAAENALGGDLRLNRRSVPKVAFTRPQAAAVGLSETEAEAMGYEVITGEAPMGVNPMAMIQGLSNGMIKVVGEQRYGEVLGVHVLAPMATEIIGQAVLAIQMEATLEDLARAVFPHPTICESLAEAARDALGWSLYQPV